MGQNSDFWTAVDAAVCTVDLMKRASGIKILIGCIKQEKEWATGPITKLVLLFPN